MPPEPVDMDAAPSGLRAPEQPGSLKLGATTKTAAQPLPKLQAPATDAHCEGVDDPGEHILLRLEVMSNAYHKGLLAFNKLSELACLCALVGMLVAQQVQANNDWFNTDRFVYTCIVCGVMALVLLGAALAWAGRAWVRARAAGKLWSRRRWRLAFVAYAIAVVQLINLVVWVGNNVRVVKMQCSWFALVTMWSTFLRESCFNTIFVLFWVSGSNTNPWPAGGLHAMVLDAPWTRHLPKLAVWVLVEVVYLVMRGVMQKHSEPSDYITVVRFRDRPCYQWDFTCKANALFTGVAVLASAIPCAYFALYLERVLRGFRMLWAAPYERFRLAQLLFRLQLRQVARAYFVVVLSAALLTFVSPASCGTYFNSLLGGIPMQLMLSLTAISGLLYFMPVSVDPENPRVLQAWLQQFSWTEAGLPTAVNARDARAPSALAGQPMFCMETAVKLLWWSHLAYQWDELHPDAEGNSSQEDGMGVGPDAAAAADASLATAVAGAVVSRLDDAKQAAEAVLQPVAGATRALDPRPAAGVEGVPQGGPQAPGAGDAAAYKVVVGDVMPTAKELDTKALGGADAAPHGGERAPMDVLEKMRLGSAMYGLEGGLEVLREPTTDTKAVLAWDRGTLILSFRGTVSLANVCTDIRTWQAVHETAPVAAAGAGAAASRGWQLPRRRRRVHAGFLRAWVTGGFGERVVAAVRQLAERGEVDLQSTQIYVTGHSLGGALATLAAYDLADRLRPTRLACYTFGAPRTGNHAFAHAYNRVVPHTWHVINDQDAVPRGGKLWGLFKRPGQRAIVNLAGDLVVAPCPLETRLRQLPAGHSVGQHLVGAYQRSLAAICAAQHNPGKALAGGATGVAALLAASPPAGVVLAQGGYQPNAPGSKEEEGKVKATARPHAAV